MQQGHNVLELKITADGSHTLFNPQLNEHYHSLHGSIQESEHVFIEKGLKYVSKRSNKLSILEVGFGTGLNALLTVINQNDLDINYVGLEPFPVNLELLSALNYTNIVGNVAYAIFEKMHQAEWGANSDISKGFRFIKVNERIQEYESEIKFDLIYYDAFAPRPQAEMWKMSVFQKLFSMMKAESCLVTYCAKGEVRRNMQAAGFEVERLEGPPGKREMLRATKNE